jgi:two-component system, OmpR family, phosphate regulon sensor histidine kinase PhoR
VAENKQRSGALLIFYTLVIYVIAQFISWAHLMLDQSEEIHSLKLKWILPTSSPGASKIMQDVLQKELIGKYYMVAGEGIVFIAILALGVIMVRKSFRKESELVAKQKTFLHSVTHEFKSPVASMRLQLETLQKRSLTAEQQQQALANAIDDTERLDRLIEKILMAARIDSGELPLHLEFINLSKKLKEIIEQVSRSSPQRNIVTNIQEDVSLNIDPWALNSIVTNLMENAFLYSAADKTVEVSLYTEANMVRLSVKDTGIGIPNSEKKKVLQKFYRSDATQGYKGTGLGLYLTDYFVKAHKGTIQVKDNTPQGSIFEISFPNTKTDGRK